MADEQRLQPETIVPDIGIKSDSGGATADWSDMVNLMPDPSGAQGVIPRLPVVVVDEFKSDISANVPSLEAGLYILQPPSYNGADSIPVTYRPMIGIVGYSGIPIDLFPYYDVFANSIPDGWESLGAEYYKPVG